MAADTPAATASWPIPRCDVPLTRFCRNRSYARFSNSRISIIFRYRSSAVSSASLAGRTVVMSCLPWRGSVLVGDIKILGREPGEDLDPVRGDHDLLLDPGRGDAVAGRAVGLQREHHALL